MLQATTAIFKESILLDLVMTGEAARMVGVDRRTFVTWAKKLKIKPVSTVMKTKLVYRREDAEKVKKAYQHYQETKGAV